MLSRAHSWLCYARPIEFVYLKLAVCVCACVRARACMRVCVCISPCVAKLAMCWYRKIDLNRCTAEVDKRTCWKEKEMSAGKYK